MNRKHILLIGAFLMALSCNAFAVETPAPHMIGTPWAIDYRDGAGFQGYCLQVGESPSTADGVAMLMRPCSYNNTLYQGAANQAFSFYWADSLNGIQRFYIKSNYSNKCLTVAGLSNADGAAIVQETCSSWSTLWWLEKAGAYLFLRSSLSGKCMIGIPRGSVFQASCGLADSYFKMAPAGANISMRVVHSYKCLDVNGTAEGLATVRQWSCLGADNQKGNIQLTTVGNGSAVPWDIRFRMVHSGKCIRPAVVTDGEFYRQYTCANTSNEFFKLTFEGTTHMGPHFSLTTNASLSLCASVNQSGAISPMSDGTRILLRQCQGQNHQLWLFTQFNP
jgi:hypothetical protein